MQDKFGSGLTGNLATSKLNVSFVFADNLVRNPESKTRSGGSLGGIKRFEESLEGYFVHADAGVGNGYANHGISGFRISGGTDSHREPSARWHRVHCIADEVHEDLAEFTFEAKDRRGRLIPSLHVDVR